jgi:hypothetical protein
MQTQTTDVSPVVVSVGLCECHAVERTEVHHRNFPELHAEGESTADAAAHLTNLLLRELDSAESCYRRTPFEEAIQEVKEFMKRLP